MSYQGNCHCGSYRFELQAENVGLEQAALCSCLLCVKQGCIWHILKEGTLSVVRDDGELVTYQTPSVEYKFCSVCGTGVFGSHFDGPLKDQAVVNIRVLRDINPFEYEKPKEYNGGGSGRSVQSTIGSCVCGSVAVELLAPLDGVDIKEDNCSICTRNAWLGAYPSKSQVILRGPEHVRDYQFGRKFMGHPFCKTCGAHVYMNVYGPPQNVIDQLPESRKALVKKKLDIVPVNVRCLNGIDIGSLKVDRSDEGTSDYEKDVLGLA